MATGRSSPRALALTLALVLSLSAAAGRARPDLTRWLLQGKATPGARPTAAGSRLEISRLATLLQILRRSELLRSEDGEGTEADDGALAGSRAARRPGPLASDLFGERAMREMKRKIDELQIPAAAQKRNAESEKERNINAVSSGKNDNTDPNTDELGEPLNPDDFEYAEKTMADQPIMDGSYFDDLFLEYDKFEGDIVLRNEMKDGRSTQHNAIRDPDDKWSRGEIPYTIASGFSSKERATIASAVLEFQRDTCVRVRPLAAGDTEYVHIIRGDGCYSSVGRQPGQKQELSLGSGCLYHGVVMHEFMHAIGFWHEQSRPDRDEHVFIHFDNIKSGTEGNFKKYDWNFVQNLSAPYDIGSIMHYGPHAFARDRNRPTITALQQTSAQMGQREALSTIDISKINSLYNCDGGAPPSPTVKPVTCVDRNDYCSAWASAGECSANPLYMEVHCARSCNTCSDAAECEDKNKHCVAWADDGECDKNPSYMLPYCRKACGRCTGRSTVACTNEDRYCEAWAEDGQCDINPSYMHQSCRKACGLC